MNRFPFGAPSTARPPRRPIGPAKAFVLGVYPSALHVRWTLPKSAPTGLPEVVGALAVADEPTVFWDGGSAADLVAKWIRDVGFMVGDGPSDHGHARAAGNGTSGRRVSDTVLAKLGVSADETWFTDAVDQYFIKRGGARREQGDVIAEVYDVFAASRPGLLAADLPRRPTVNGLVSLAATQHRDRLRAELGQAAAPLLVTLGEEARRVLAEVADIADGAPLVPLTRGAEIARAYGEPGEASVSNVTMKWFALAHPGNRDTYWTELHAAWGARQERS